MDSIDVELLNLKLNRLVDREEEEWLPIEGNFIVRYIG